MSSQLQRKYHTSLKYIYLIVILSILTPVISTKPMSVNIIYVHHTTSDLLLSKYSKDYVVAIQGDSIKAKKKTETHDETPISVSLPEDDLLNIKHFVSSSCWKKKNICMICGANSCYSFRIETNGINFGKRFYVEGLKNYHNVVALQDTEYFFSGAENSLLRWNLSDEFLVNKVVIENPKNYMIKNCIESAIKMAYFSKIVFHVIRETTHLLGFDATNLNSKVVDLDLKSNADIWSENVVDFDTFGFEPWKSRIILCSLSDSCAVFDYKNSQFVSIARFASGWVSFIKVNSIPESRFVVVASSRENIKIFDTSFNSLTEKTTETMNDWVAATLTDFEIDYFTADLLLTINLSVFTVKFLASALDTNFCSQSCDASGCTSRFFRNFCKTCGSSFTTDAGGCMSSDPSGGLGDGMIGGFISDLSKLVFNKNDGIFINSTTPIDPPVDPPVEPPVEPPIIEPVPETPDDKIILNLSTLWLIIISLFLAATLIITIFLCRKAKEKSRERKKKRKMNKYLVKNPNSPEFLPKQLILKNNHQHQEDIPHHPFDFSSLTSSEKALKTHHFDKSQNYSRNREVELPEISFKNRKLRSMRSDEGFTGDLPYNQKNSFDFDLEDEEYRKSIRMKKKLRSQNLGSFESISYDSENEISPNLAELEEEKKPEKSDSDNDEVEDTEEADDKDSSFPELSSINDEDRELFSPKAPQFKINELNNDGVGSPFKFN